jgi:hypothetical protein
MLRIMIIALVTSAAVALDPLSARIEGWWHYLRRRRRQSIPKRNLNDGTQERRKSKIAIQLLMLATYATALVVVPAVTPAKAATSSSKHIKKHQRKIQNSFGFSDTWSAGQAWPGTGLSSQAGPVCPGIARSIDCRIWPPPFDEDPDRKRGGGGGG